MPVQFMMISLPCLMMGRLAPRCALASSPSLWQPVAVGHDGRLLRARTRVPLRGRLWMLDYARDTGSARLGGRRAVAGRFGGVRALTRRTLRAASGAC
jgi:hypothetical protein